MDNQHDVRKPSSNEETKLYHKIKIEQYLSMFSVVAQSFDKAILSLSTASLGFTFIFLKYIQVDKEILNHTWILKMSWMAFILAIIFIVLALIFAQDYARHQADCHSERMLGLEDSLKLHRCRDGFMIIFQYFSFFSFVVGLISFTVFVWLHL